MIFKKIKINKVELKNRIIVSPMCQYSAKNGCPTDWHYRHLSNLIKTGAGMLMLESTAINKRGKITHSDLSLYNHEQEKKLKKLKHKLKQINDIPIGIQISHSGRKGSSFVPWIKPNTPLNKKNNSWQTYSASAINRTKGWPNPEVLTRKQILSLVKDFRNTSLRAKRIGFECLEVHMAHGYLLHQFLSPISNLRKDEFGGSKANRMRFPLLICNEIRRVWPKDRILGARITGTDHLKKGISVDDAILLTKELKKIGFDYVCVSSGGILPKTNLRFKKAFRRTISKKIKKNTNIKVRTSGMINDANIIENMLKDKSVDFVAVGRKFISDSNWILKLAKTKNLDDYIDNQYKRCF